MYTYSHMHTHFQNQACFGSMLGQLELSIGCGRTLAQQEEDDSEDGDLDVGGPVRGVLVVVHHCPCKVTITIPNLLNRAHSMGVNTFDPLRGVLGSEESQFLSCYGGLQEGGTWM